MFRGFFFAITCAHVSTSCKNPVVYRLFGSIQVEKERYPLIYVFHFCVLDFFFLAGHKLALKTSIKKIHAVTFQSYFVFVNVCMEVKVNVQRHFDIWNYVSSS